VDASHYRRQVNEDKISSHGSAPLTTELSARAQLCCRCTVTKMSGSIFSFMGHNHSAGGMQSQMVISKCASMAKRNRNACQAQRETTGLHMLRKLVINKCGSMTEWKTTRIRATSSRAVKPGLYVSTNLLLNKCASMAERKCHRILATTSRPSRLAVNIVGMFMKTCSWHRSDLNTVRTHQERAAAVPHRKWRARQNML